MYCRRPGITLFGGEASRAGRSMSGIHYKVEKDGRMKLYTEEYSELKEFIDENFMKPLVKKNMRLIKLNAFNFEYLIKKLKAFALMYKDAEIFLQLIETIKATMEITDENDRLNEIVYGQSSETRLEFHTKAVEFLPEYQIYCSLYGPPEEFDAFDMDKLDDIKLVLKRNPALTYREFMIKFGLSVENIHFQNVKHKKEKQSEIRWKDLPDDPQERRALKLAGHRFVA